MYILSQIKWQSEKICAEYNALENNNIIHSVRSVDPSHFNHKNGRLTVTCKEAQC